MRFATTREIEYLSSMDGQGEDADLVREMARRLDALRRYDQYVREADWRPRRPPRGRKSSKRLWAAGVIISPEGVPPRLFANSQEIRTPIDHESSQWTSIGELR